MPLTATPISIPIPAFAREDKMVPPMFFKVEPNLEVVFPVLCKYD